MSTKAVPLNIPNKILEEVYREARRSFPAECCGWLAGPVGGQEVSNLRQCANALPNHASLSLSAGGVGKVGGQSEQLERGRVDFSASLFDENENVLTHVRFRRSAVPTLHHLRFLP